RIGRTGRVEKSGEAFTFVERDDEDLVRQVEKLLGHRIEREYLEGFNYNVAAPVRQNNPNQRSGRNNSYRGNGNRGGSSRVGATRGVPNRTNSNRRSGTR
ncbi:MAG: hypothetical protein MUQ30_05590, partial [Anaerolineae bacterium]|nr:hypothetical protein [Anaerolineae bacterium]